jgi:hypothetical protein
VNIACSWTLVSVEKIQAMSAKPTEAHESLIRRAQRVRMLADLLAGDPAAERLRTYADELDAQAAAADSDNKNT